MTLVAMTCLNRGRGGKASRLHLHKCLQDAPNFFGSSYSVTKGFTDRLFHQFEGTALNLRMRPSPASPTAVCVSYCEGVKYPKSPPPTSKHTA